MGSHMLTTKLVLITLCIHGMVHMRQAEAATSLAQQCSTAIQQLISCLSFATGKGAEPTKECCTSVSTMKDKQPVCLCFFIGQAHNGSEQIKNLGIQEAKLIQLPSACQLTNASVSNCPKLLGISPTSPAAAIFKDSNGTSPTAATSTSSPSTTATTTATGSNSSGFKHGNNGVLACFLTVLVSTFLGALPLGNNIKFLF